MHESAGEAIVNVLLSLILGPFVVTGATVAHKQEQLCYSMGGTWTPANGGVPPWNSGNVCPGGSLYKWVFEHRKQPTQPTAPVAQPK